jgi:hypothetical protein
MSLTDKQRAVLQMLAASPRGFSLSTVMARVRVTRDGRIGPEVPLTSTRIARISPPLSVATSNGIA